MKQALVLCSGGLDSVTTAFYSKKLSYSPTLLFFNYSQNSLKEERKAVKYFAKKLPAELIEIKIPELIPKNALTSKIKIPKSKSLKDTSKESQGWYVPQRNLVFLSIASSIAESLINNAASEASQQNKTPIIRRRISSAHLQLPVQFRQSVKHKQGAKRPIFQKIDLFVGFKSEGSESYPDTTEEFVTNFDRLIKKSSSGKISLLAPLIKKDKEDIIKLANLLKIETEKTFSCYSPKSGLHCSKCLACRLRKAGFYWANEKDKTKYFV